MGTDLTRKKEAVGGSYRDPAGRVYRIDGKLFRSVLQGGMQAHAILTGSDFIQGLVADGKLVPFQDVAPDSLDFGPNGAAPLALLDIAPLPFISHPYEWSFAALKKAALFHLDLQLAALEQGIVLVDASAYNVQFQGPTPIFIDHLSFRPYREGELWLAHRQFCEQFLHPLVFQARVGLPFNAWYRGTLDGIAGTALSAVLPFRARFSPNALLHIFLPAFFDKRAHRATPSTDLKNAVLPRARFRGMLTGLRNWIAGLRPKGIEPGGWTTYERTNTYAPAEHDAKRAFVAEMMSATRPERVWDLGCNTGAFSELALQSGAAKAIGFDFDPATVDLAFQRAEARQLDFLPLVQDFQNPSPSVGWRQAERDGLIERRNADAVLALALVHHLSLGRNIPLDEAVGWIVDTAPTGIIEFVPKSDPVVPGMLRNRVDVFDTYTEAAFDLAVRNNAKIVKEARITDTGRKLVWFERST